MSTSSLMSVSGLGSGLDWRTLIDEIIAIERRPINNLLARKDGINQKKSVWSDIATKLSALKTSIDRLSDPSAFEVKKVLYSVAGVVEVTPSWEATPATYSMTVNSLAKAHTIGSDDFADTGTALGLTGTFTVNGKSVTLDVSDTLLSIRDKISEAAGDTVSAQVIDGTLVLKSLNTGTANTITLVDDGSTHCLQALGLLDDVGNLKHVLQPSADAVVVIDGVTVTRSSNTISDAVPGVTLKLLKEGPDASTEVTITTDVDAVAGKIKDFVNSYNAVMSLVNTAGGKEGDLQGDFGLVIVSSRIRRGATDPVSGSTFGALWQVGVWTSNESGLLSVDEAKLKAELEKNPAAVKDLFFTADTSTEGVGERLSKGIADLTSSPDGLVYSRGKALSDMMTDIDKRVEQLEYRLDMREEYLIRQFTAMEAALVQLQQHSLWLSNPWMSGGGSTA